MSEPSETPNVRLAVLISGTGRTLANLIESIAAEALEAEVVAVVSSRAGVRGIEIAEVAGIPVSVVTRKPYSDDASFSDAIYAAITPYEPDLIICAGFLKAAGRAAGVGGPDPQHPPLPDPGVECGRPLAITAIVSTKR